MSIADLDGRRLYLGEGCSSLFTCTQVLYLSEHAAWTKREVEHLVATLHPRPDVPRAIGKLPAAGQPSESATRN